jgi:hypothetical protein
MKWFDWSTNTPSRTNRWVVLMLRVVTFAFGYRLLALVETARVMSVPARDDRLRLIRHILAEWGVDNDNGQYDGFCGRAEARIDRLPLSMIPEDLNVIGLASPVLPKSIKDAIQVVIENEIRNVQTDLERGITFTLTHDRLSHPFPPLKVDVDRQTGKSKTVPRFPFKDLFRTNPEALNPFVASRTRRSSRRPNTLVRNGTASPHRLPAKFGKRSYRTGWNTRVAPAVSIVVSNDVCVGLAAAVVSRGVTWSASNANHCTKSSQRRPSQKSISVYLNTIK